MAPNSLPDASWALLASLGVLLGPSWGVLGALLGSLGTLLAALGAFLAAVGGPPDLYKTIEK